MNCRGVNYQTINLLCVFTAAFSFLHFTSASKPWLFPVANTDSWRPDGQVNDPIATVWFYCFCKVTRSDGNIFKTISVHMQMRFVENVVPKTTDQYGSKRHRYHLNTSSCKRGRGHSCCSSFKPSCSCLMMKFLSFEHGWTSRLADDKRIILALWCWCWFSVIQVMVVLRDWKKQKTTGLLDLLCKKLLQF